MTIYSSDLITTALNKIPSRVVSLVPSTTESLFAFGLGDRLVGVTDFCPIEETGVESPARIGGTKTTDIETVVSLEPDLIIVNQEENNQDIVETLAESGIPIWMSFPQSVQEAIGELWIVIRIFNRERELAAQVDTLQRSLEWTNLAFRDHSRVRYFCPIWKEAEPGWWMTFNQNTYAHDILKCCGGENIFPKAELGYPPEITRGKNSTKGSQDHEVRYPRVNVSEIIAAKPQLILLPSEPYAFNSEDVREMTDLLADTPAISNHQIHLVDGRLITWHGIRMAEAISALPGYFQLLESDA